MTFRGMWIQRSMVDVILVLRASCSPQSPQAADTLHCQNRAATVHSITTELRVQRALSQLEGCSVSDAHEINGQ